MKEESYELLISGRKCALTNIGAQIKLYVLQWTSGHLAKRLGSFAFPGEFRSSGATQLAQKVRPCT